MNALTTPAAPSAPTMQNRNLLLDFAMFDHLQRVGKVLALSPLFPQHLRSGSQEQAIANGMLVFNMAHRLQEDPLTVAQNIYFVGGRPGWNTTYMIAKANQHGVFKDVIDWEVKGKGDSLSVTAFAVLSGTGRRVSVTLDMETAKKEGWTKNTKYQSIPEQMLRYRTAAFLIRLYCPEVMVGVPSAIEIELEAKDVTPYGGPAVVEPNDEPPVEVKAEEAQAVDTAAEEAKRAEAEQAEAARVAQEKANEEAAEAKRAAAAQTQAQTQKPAQDPLDLRQSETQPQTTTQPAAAPEDDPEVAERWEHLLGLMLDEVRSGSSASELEEVYGPQIAQMRAQFPALAKRLDEALANALTR